MTFNSLLLLLLPIRIIYARSMLSVTYIEIYTRSTQHFSRSSVANKICLVGRKKNTTYAHACSNMCLAFESVTIRTLHSTNLIFLLTENALFTVIEAVLHAEGIILTTFARYKMNDVRYPSSKNGTDINLPSFWCWYDSEQKWNRTEYETL